MLFVILALCILLPVKAEDCGTCPIELNREVCGEDKNTYSSFCELLRQECTQDKLIGFQCDGKCPCDPEEISQFDEDTVKKLADLRMEFQLEGHIEDMEPDRTNDNNDSEDLLNFDILDIENTPNAGDNDGDDEVDDVDKEEEEGEEEKEDVEEEEEEEEEEDRCTFPPAIGNCKERIPSFYFDQVSQRCESFFYSGCDGNKNRFKSNARCTNACNPPNCPTNERINLPSRLIDWFHVLRANEKEKQSGELLKQMNFMDGKLRAMYSRLACENNDGIAGVKEDYCLPPVEWMFKHLDTDNDNNLSSDELMEIQELHNEYCIRPFLQVCDRDDNDKVELKEFCKCLCHTPPCTHLLENIPAVLLNGRPEPLPGRFAPQCDEDGFFMPKQINEVKKEQWCVDRNGAEYFGSRKGMSETVDCGVNTRYSKNKVPLIPLSMKRENTPQ